MKKVILGIVIFNLMIAVCWGAACDKPEPITEACAPIATACEPIGEIAPEACARVYTGQVCTEQVYTGQVYTYEYVPQFIPQNTIPMYQEAGIPVRMRTPIIRRNLAPSKTEIIIKRERTPRF